MEPVLDCYGWGLSCELILQKQFELILRQKQTLLSWLKLRNAFFY